MEIQETSRNGSNNADKPFKRQNRPYNIAL